MTAPLVAVIVSEPSSATDRIEAIQPPQRHGGDRPTQLIRNTRNLDVVRLRILLNDLRGTVGVKTHDIPKHLLRREALGKLRNAALGHDRAVRDHEFLQPVFRRGIIHQNVPALQGPCTVPRLDPRHTGALSLGSSFTASSAVEPAAKPLAARRATDDAKNGAYKFPGTGAHHIGRAPFFHRNSHPLKNCRLPPDPRPTFRRMIIAPKIRGFICITAHPEGCAAHVQEQIDFVQKKGAIDGLPKRVLVIGASTSWPSSRIVPAFAGGAATLGVFFEKPAEPQRTGSAGWYNSIAFEKAAHAAGLYAKSVNGDAFSDAIKQQVIDMIKADLGTVDAVI